MTGNGDPQTFRLLYVPGVTPGKWVRTWNERMREVPLVLEQSPPAAAADALRKLRADAGLLRLPADRDELSVIPLYTETTVVVVPKDHLVAAADEVTIADLADDVVLHPLDDTLPWEAPPGRPAFQRPETTEDAVELVAAGIGLLVVPQSLARLHHRRDLTYRPVTDAPQSGVGLAWREDTTTDDVDDFVGIVRGRTANSTRGQRQQAEPAKAAKAERGRAAGAGGGVAAKGRGQGTAGRRGAGGSRAGGRSGGARRGGQSGGRGGGGRGRR
ncbi:LysR substrate-binding domain-containing protein [Streptomyces spiramenti]|uniref:LysR family substrate-binding domain-containing protein n=1 Tax=Streptomyces spiramenti TaxID=2720606 RepID=A0ABX1AIZ8_9ACTN|nr:LysR family substrate-binding domain-containing protein [Streptomyces spiramenti]